MSAPAPCTVGTPPQSVAHTDVEHIEQPRLLSERDLDRDILRNRVHYDRAECSPAWYEDEDLAAELARIDAEAQAWISDRTLKLIAWLVLATAVLGAIAVAYLERPRP
jgi:hypothetical protein